MSTGLLVPFVRPSCQWCDDVFIAGTHPKSTCGKECLENLKRLREDLKYDMTPNVPVSHDVMLCILKTAAEKSKKIWYTEALDSINGNKQNISKYFFNLRNDGEFFRICTSYDHGVSAIPQNFPADLLQYSGEELEKRVADLF